MLAHSYLAELEHCIYHKAQEFQDRLYLLHPPVFKNSKKRKCSACPYAKGCGITELLLDDDVPSEPAGFLFLEPCFLIEIARYVSDVPPAHYTVKIESFSLFAKNSVDRFESGEFESGGYKWKLVLHPLGNKSKNVNDHISLYLAIAGTDSLQPNWEVFIVYRLFLLNQNNDNYLTVEDGKWKPRRFRGMKKECGFDKYISLKEFNDSVNGYVVDDVCVFGAEVFVCKENFKGAKGECLSMIKNPIIYKHIWKIDNFSKLDAESYESRIFNAENQKWKIRVYPKGRGSGEGSHLSLFVALADPTTLHPATKIYAEVTLCVQDQVHSKHHSGKVSYWFSASNPEVGGLRFILLSNFRQPNMGFLVKDICVVEAEVTVIGVANAFS